MCSSLLSLSVQLLSSFHRPLVGKGPLAHPLMWCLDIFQRRTNRGAWTALVSDLLRSPILSLDAPDFSESSLCNSFALTLTPLTGTTQNNASPSWKWQPFKYSSGHMEPFSPLRLNILHLSIIPHRTKFRVPSPFWPLSSGYPCAS